MARRTAADGAHLPRLPARTLDAPQCLVPSVEHATQTLGDAYQRSTRQDGTGWRALPFQDSRSNRIFTEQCTAGPPWPPPTQRKHPPPAFCIPPPRLLKMTQLTLLRCDGRHNPVSSWNRTYVQNRSRPTGGHAVPPAAGG